MILVLVQGGLDCDGKNCLLSMIGCSKEVYKSLWYLRSTEIGLRFLAGKKHEVGNIK